MIFIHEFPSIFCASFFPVFFWVVVFVDKAENVQKTTHIRFHTNTFMKKKLCRIWKLPAVSVAVCIEIMTLQLFFHPFADESARVLFLASPSQNIVMPKLLCIYIFFSSLLFSVLCCSYTYSHILLNSTTTTSENEWGGWWVKLTQFVNGWWNGCELFGRVWEEGMMMMRKFTI